MAREIQNFEDGSMRIVEPITEIFKPETEEDIFIHNERYFFYKDKNGEWQYYYGPNDVLKDAHKIERAPHGEGLIVSNFLVGSPEIPQSKFLNKKGSGEYDYVPIENIGRSMKGYYLSEAISHDGIQLLKKFFTGERILLLPTEDGYKALLVTESFGRVAWLSSFGYCPERHLFYCRKNHNYNSQCEYDEVRIILTGDPKKPYKVRLIIQKKKSSDKESSPSETKANS